ncbi:unnamed protein product [Clonostachys rosea]|uniref:Uncharacterized protein n=1 Tax=Bionectria ochroleuca TaxID=29856 RepID=A0ABY6TSW5_BIOOC|nr:unnamed protein product [Clonostachys rosea]
MPVVSHPGAPRFSPASGWHPASTLPELAPVNDALESNQVDRATFDAGAPKTLRQKSQRFCVSHVAKPKNCPSQSSDRGRLVCSAGALARDWLRTQLGPALRTPINEPQGVTLQPHRRAMQVAGRQEQYWEGPITA